MKRFRSILLTVILTLALCFSVVACNGAGATKYTLSFEMNGHGTAIEAVKYGVDEETAEPDSPSESGWRFDGWYEDEELYFPFYFGDTIDEDTTVYAKWTQVFNVTINTGVSDFTIEAQQIAAGKLVNLPASDTIKSAGKKFEGWYADAGFTVPFDAQTTPITRDLTIHAKWTPYFVVTFDRNERGSSARTPKPQEYDVEGSKAVRPEDMSANSYRFLGWSVSKDGSAGLYDFDTVLTDSITLYAQWVRLFKVSFDLNNSQALQMSPEEQSVEDGAIATRPETDPVIAGFRFDGWYTKAEGGELFNFENNVINETTIIYAHWTKTQVETLDVETPEYSYREEAAYGERPDLDGFIIDGKMGDDEKWEEQNWYVTGTTDAPTVLYKISTKFSEKGLYVFISVEDNGGLYHDGRNYYFKNSNLEFRIMDGVHRNNWYRIDTETLYPSSQRVKIAVNIAEGEVNTADAENKRAVMNVEMFATWADLQFFKIPEKVGIHAYYKYKRLASDNIKYTLTTPFTDTATIAASDYIWYDTNGYINIDAEDATLGASSLNIAKTTGWDISHENDETDRYVSTNGAATQAIFYKNIVDTNYYEFEFEIDGSKFTNSGKAGALIYNSSINYAMLLFSVDNNTYDKNTGKFIKAKPYIKVTDKNGKLVTKILDEIDISDGGQLQVKVIFSNGYIYCIVNGTLIHCEFVPDLNVRTNPGLCSTEGGAGVRFRNYSAQVFTEAEAQVETAKYAYVLSIGRLRNLTISLSTTGVSSKEDVSKKIVMSLTNSTVVLTNSQKNKILESGEIDSRIQLHQLETLNFEVNGEEHDIMDLICDPETGAKYGEFILNYPFKGNSIITNTTSVIPTEELTYITGKIVDSITGDPIAAVATITSNNPRFSKYDMGVTGGDIVLVVPKGYDYKITFSQTAYRNTILDVMENVTEPGDVGTIKLVPNVLGGTALSKKSSMSFGSSIAGWDMTNESDGMIIFETTKANPPPVFFSGYTINEYQYAKLSVSNVTDITAYTEYEKDPAIGFRIVNDKHDGSFIGLRMNGTRYLDGLGGWNPVQNDTYGKPTANFIDPTGEHKDTLEILRIKRSLYSWVNGVYMGCIILPEAFETEAALAVSGTFSYYSKIIYRDYEIQVGDAAIAIAKEKVGLTINLDDTSYEWKEDYTGRDYEKPLLKIEGLTEVVRDDGTKEEIALAGTSFTVSRTEFANSDELYRVSVGSYGNLILSSDAPSGTITIPASAGGVANISMTREKSSTITGKYVGVEITAPLTGIVQMSDGTFIPFTTGIDGSFSISVPVSSVFTLKLDMVGKVAPAVTARSLTAGKERDLGELALYNTILGGTVAGTSYKSDLPYGEYSVGYDVDENTPYEGEFLEVEATYQNQYVAINTGMYGNFDASFSLIRYQYNDRPNESDPAFGLQIINSSGNDQILFHKDGVRSFPKGKATVMEYGIMKYNTATSYGVRVDFRIVRRNSSYFMFYKLESDPDWIMIKTIESTLTGNAALRFMSCTSKALHYVAWNFKINKLVGNNIPEDLMANINVNVSSGAETGSTSMGGGTEIDGELNFVYGDVAIVNLKPASGYIPAYAKVNGEFVDIVSNRFQFSVDRKNVDVEVVFEPYFETLAVTGKIAVDNTYSDFELPSSVNIVAAMADGRTYTFNNVSVANDGTVLIQLRAGTFKMYANTATLASKAIDVTISNINKNFGTLTLSTMRSGEAVVNGKVLTTVNPMGESLLYSDGMLNLPVAQGTSCWLPEAVASGDFVFAADIIQSGNPESPYYSNDEVAGFIFSDGTNTFAMQFWGDGLRISAIGYTTTGMLWPHINKDVAYFGKLASNAEKKVNFAVKLVGSDMKVYINYKHIFTMTTDKGFVWADGVTGTDHYPANNDTVKGIYANVFADTSKDVAIGYQCNLNRSGSTYTNQAGFYNVQFTQKESLVSSFNGKF